MIAASTESLLGILKWALLALLYLFFARVLWAVWSEVRQPRQVQQPVAAPAQSTARPAPAFVPAGPNDPTVAAAPPLGDATLPAARHTSQPSPAPGAAPDLAPSSKRIPKGRRGQVGRLVITQPRASKGVAFSTATELTIGRAEGSAITLTDDTYASQLHARVYPRAGGVWVEDLGSTNGTHLNGARLRQPTQLDVGDRIQVGNTILEAQ